MNNRYEGCEAIIQENIATIQMHVDSLNDTLHLKLTTEEILKLSHVNVLLYPSEKGLSHAFRLMGEAFVPDKIKPAVFDKKTGEMIKPKRIIAKYYQTAQIINLSKKKIDKLSNADIKQTYIDCYTIEYCLKQIQELKKMKEKDKELETNMKWIYDTFGQ